MPVTKAPDDMSDMQWGLGFGCSIAIFLMIFSCVLFIQELHEYLTYRPPLPSSPTRPDVPISSAPPIRYESPPPIRYESPPPIRYESPPPIRYESPPPIRYESPPPIRYESPPPYDTVVPARSKFPIKPGTLDPRSLSPPVRVFGYGSPSPIVPVALTEVVVHRPAYAGRAIEVKCLLPVCEEYFRSLKLDLYFQQKRDCYCKKCQPDNRQKTYKRGGYDFTIPYGWVRFRIQTDRAHAGEKKIFKDWTTSYYGTREEKLEQILRNRLMPLPGDALSDGTIYSDESVYGKQWLTSPSINYVSDSRFSPMKSFELPNRIGEIYNVQVVLQCRQKPQTFDVRPGRPGICDFIPANVIEWTSNHRSTLIPTGLMMRMVKI